jgi:hypothetical protein
MFVSAGMEVHNEMKKKIHKLPVETIDSMGQRLLHRYIICVQYRSHICLRRYFKVVRE